MKIGRKVPPHGGNGKLPGGIPIMRPHHKDGLNTDRSGKPVIISEPSIYLVAWISQRIWCTIYSDYIGNSQRSLLSPTGGVKNTSPTTENWLRKLYEYSMNNYKSNEDNHQINYSMNTDTRNMHITWACNESARFLPHLFILSHMHLLVQVLSLVTCHPCTCASLLEFTSLISLLRSVLHRPLLFSSLSFTPSSTLSSTTWSPCKNPAQLS